MLWLGSLQAAINRDFGSLDVMKERLSAATVGIQGSGWGWLGYNKVSGKLQIATCPNQVRFFSGANFYKLLIGRCSLWASEENRDDSCTIFFYSLIRLFKRKSQLDSSFVDRGTYYPNRDHPLVALEHVPPIK